METFGSAAALFCILLEQLYGTVYSSTRMSAKFVVVDSVEAIANIVGGEEQRKDYSTDAGNVVVHSLLDNWHCYCANHTLKINFYFWAGSSRRAKKKEIKEESL